MEILCHPTHYHPQPSPILFMSSLMNATEQGKQEKRIICAKRVKQHESL